MPRARKPRARIRRRRAAEASRRVSNRAALRTQPTSAPVEWYRLLCDRFGDDAAPLASWLTVLDSRKRRGARKIDVIVSDVAVVVVDRAVVDPPIAVACRRHDGGILAPEEGTIRYVYRSVRDELADALVRLELVLAALAHGEYGMYDIVAPRLVPGVLLDRLEVLSTEQRELLLDTFPRLRTRLRNLAGSASEYADRAHRLLLASLPERSHPPHIDGNRDVMVARAVDWQHHWLEVGLKTWRTLKAAGVPDDEAVSTMRERLFYTDDDIVLIRGIRARRVTKATAEKLVGSALGLTPDSVHRMAARGRARLSRLRVQTDPMLYQISIQEAEES